MQDDWDPTLQKSKAYEQLLIDIILGVLPLVLASGAGAAARRSLGIAVATGMLASTCLAVLFVPALFVVLRRWIERKGPAPHAAGAVAAAATPPGA